MRGEEGWRATACLLGEWRAGTEEFSWQVPLSLNTLETDTRAGVSTITRHTPRYSPSPPAQQQIFCIKLQLVRFLGHFEGEGEMEKWRIIFINQRAIKELRWVFVNYLDIVIGQSVASLETYCIQERATLCTECQGHGPDIIRSKQPQ